MTSLIPPRLDNIFLSKKFVNMIQFKLIYKNTFLMFLFAMAEGSRNTPHLKQLNILEIKSQVKLVCS